MSGEALDKLIGEIKSVTSFFSAGNIKPADATAALQETQDRLHAIEEKLAGLTGPQKP